MGSGYERAELIGEILDCLTTASALRIFNLGSVGSTEVRKSFALVEKVVLVKVISGVFDGNGVVTSAPFWLAVQDRYFILACEPSSEVKLKDIPLTEPFFGAVNSIVSTPELFDVAFMW